MTVPAVLIQKSTKSIIKYGEYPREDMQPIEDLDPDFEWLITNIPFSEPVYDPRIYIMVTNLPDLNYFEDFQEHPLYSGLKEYRITYSPERRDIEDIISSIKNVEKEANGTIWEKGDSDKIILMLTSVLKIASGLQLNQFEQQQINDLSDITVKLLKNQDNRNLLINQLNSNQIPNIDLGWEKSL
jgi:hypothetical protein